VDKNPEIQKPLFQPLGNVLRISAVKVIAHARVFLPQLPGGLGNEEQAAGLAAADIHVSGNFRVYGAELSLCFIHHGNDLLRPFAQKHAGRCQGYPVAAPNQKLLPQLLLQVMDLPGKGGLGHMQQICRPCDRLLSGHRQKVSQYSQLQGNALPNAFYTCDCSKV
jgi:hypothetical protein